jgi:hypothetical protein
VTVAGDKNPFETIKAGEKTVISNELSIAGWMKTKNGGNVPIIIMTRTMMLLTEIGAGVTERSGLCDLCHRSYQRNLRTE